MPSRYPIGPCAALEALSVAELVDHPGPTADPAPPAPGATSASHGRAPRPRTAAPSGATAAHEHAGPEVAAGRAGSAGDSGHVAASVEIRVLAGLQRRVRGRAVGVARGMSHFGEHAGGWLALGA